MKRRKFLQAVGLASAGLAQGALAGQAATREHPGDLSDHSLTPAKVFIVDTFGLPHLGQDFAACRSAEAALRRIGLNVQVIKAGYLSRLVTLDKGAILLWEGPVCRNTDWPHVDAFLRRGGALFWWGKGKPFSNPVDASGKILASTDVPANILTQGTLQTIPDVKATAQWTLTTAGKEIWPDLAMARRMSFEQFLYLTTDDSVYLQNNWPWVEFIPLLTIGYTATNWVFLTRAFTGSVATLLRHRAGRYAGARVLLACLGNSKTSPLSSSNRQFSAALIGAIRALALPVRTEPSLANLPRPAGMVTRKDFFSDSGGVLGCIDYGDAAWGDAETIYAVKRLRMNVVVAGIPWLDAPAKDGSVIDWAATDKLVAQAQAGGWAVIFDGWLIALTHPGWATQGGVVASNYDPAFRNRFGTAMVNIAQRYASEPAVVGLFATPTTGTSLFGVDDSPLGKSAWAAYAVKQGLPADLPRPPKENGFDLSPARAGYIQFWSETYLAFMRDVIQSIREKVPDMPLLLRGAYFDAALQFQLASEFKNVAPHCECVETSRYVESTFRGFAQRYGVPISGENGWPKERGAALRMSIAAILLGGYNDFEYSFGGPLWARPGLKAFEALSRVWPYLRGSRYAPSHTAILVPDTTMWASDWPKVRSHSPSIRSLMERSGIPFQAVSSQWPKLDGIEILIAERSNDILADHARRAIANWVKHGGMLIAFPETGRFDASGSSVSLARSLGMETLVPGETRVGAGKLVVLDGSASRVLESEAKLIDIVKTAGAVPPIEVTPAVAQAVFVKERRVYLVAYNESTRLISAFFDESQLPAIEGLLPSVAVTATLPRGTRRARDLVAKADIPVVDGRVRFWLPRTEWRVVEFSP